MSVLKKFRARSGEELINGFAEQFQPPVEMLRMQRLQRIEFRPDGVERGVRGLRTEGGSIDQGGGILGRLVEASPTSAADIARVEQDYGPVALAIVDMASNGQHAAAVAKMGAECRPLLAALLQASARYADYTERRASALVAQAAESSQARLRMLVTVCVLAFAFAVACGVAITRSLSRALGAEPHQLGRAAQRVADGSPATIRSAAA